MHNTHIISNQSTEAIFGENNYFFIHELMRKIALSHHLIVSLLGKQFQLTDVISNHKHPKTTHHVQKTFPIIILQLNPYIFNASQLLVRIIDQQQ